MGRQPEVVAQDRLEALDARVQERDVGRGDRAQKRDRRPGQRGEDLAIDHLEDERQDRGHQRDPDDRLIHVGHRGPARDPHAEVKPVDLQSDPDGQRRQTEAVDRRPHERRRTTISRSTETNPRLRSKQSDGGAIRERCLPERVHRVEVGLALDHRDGADTWWG